MNDDQERNNAPEKPQDKVPAPRREIRHFKAVNIIYYLAGVIEVLLVFRFIFRLFAANAASGIVMFIDSVSAPFMAPFNMIFPTSPIGNGGLEWPILIAMAVYLIVAFGIVQLINVIVARAPQEEM